MAAPDSRRRLERTADRRIAAGAGVGAVRRTYTRRGRDACEPRQESPPTGAGDDDFWYRCRSAIGRYRLRIATVLRYQQRQSASPRRAWQISSGWDDGGAWGVNSGRLGQIPRGLLGRRLAAMATEPPRDSRRLHFLRGWSHEQIDGVFTGGSRAGGTVSVREPGGARLAVGGDRK